MARVLVIDDESDVVRLIGKILASCGHTCQIARDGVSALARAVRELPDLIIIDSELPKLSGAEVCRQLKTTPATEAIPIILMTSSYIDIDAVGAAAGPDAFVVRPFGHAVLSSVVERALIRANGAA